MSNLVDLIKQVSKGVQDSSAPMSVYYGTVTTVNPLQVTVDQRFILSEVFLVVPETLTAYSATVGDTTIEIRRGLEVGDKLVLLRAHGGQQYVIMDRVV